jgi:hypothetical protein
MLRRHVVRFPRAREVERTLPTPPERRGAPRSGCRGHARGTARRRPRAGALAADRVRRADRQLAYRSRRSARSNVAKGMPPSSMRARRRRTGAFRSVSARSGQVDALRCPSAALRPRTGAAPRCRSSTRPASYVTAGVNTPRHSACRRRRATTRLPARTASCLRRTRRSPQSPLRRRARAATKTCASPGRPPLAAGTPHAERGEGGCRRLLANGACTIRH